MDKNISLVFLTAGISSRFGGKIKQLAIIGPNNETLIEYSVNQAIKNNIFKRIIFIIGDKTELAIKNIFGEKYRNIEVIYTKQEYDVKNRDRPWGTGDAISTIYNKIDGPVIICNGDDIYGEATFNTAYNIISNNKDNFTMAYKLINTIPENGNVNRGIINTDDYNNIIEIIEKLNINKINVYELNISECLCSTNFYGLSKSIIEYIYIKNNQFKENHKNDRTIESMLPLILSKGISRNIFNIKCYKSNDMFYGITNPEDEHILRNILNKE